MIQATKILILGGGFGGLYTALELEKGLSANSDVEITLVNRDNFFLFTPMLHEVAASDLDPTDIVKACPARSLDLFFSKDLVQFKTNKPATVPRVSDAKQPSAA